MCFTVVQVVVNHPAIKDGEREREGMREVVLVCVCEGGREERKSSTLLMISSPSLLLHAKHTLICPTDTHHKGVCVCVYCHRNVAHNTHKYA